MAKFIIVDVLLSDAQAREYRRLLHTASMKFGREQGGHRVSTELSVILDNTETYSVKKRRGKLNTARGAATDERLFYHSVATLTKRMGSIETACWSRAWVVYKWFRAVASRATSFMESEVLPATHLPPFNQTRKRVAVQASRHHRSFT